MKSVDWGSLYDAHSDKTWNPSELEDQIATLYADDDVTKHSGIYAYVLDGNGRHLSIRKFTDPIKARVHAKQGGKCKRCEETVDLRQSDADHITQWAHGGKTVEDNCQVLCKSCHKAVS